MENSLKDHLYALIVCGGSGTRLWPRSRQKTPKQFLTKFWAEKTLFVQTVERASLLTSNEKIFVITLDDYIDEVLQQGKIILPKNVIVEPFGRNTAMAVGVGAAFIRKADPEAIIMNFWADAVVKENEIFTESLNFAAKVASQGNFLVIIGLKPSFPHTGLGYLEAGEKLGGELGEVFKVNSFKEKPDLTTAQEFLKRGNFFWNTGLFAWSAKAIFEAFSKYSPPIFTLLEGIFQSVGTAEERQVMKKAYETVGNVAIDVAVCEKAENLVLVPASFTWSDIGNWKVTYDLKEKDENNNVVEIFGSQGQHFGVETRNCLVEAEDRLIATVGVSDLVIIETKDAVLVCSKEKAQEVKKIVNLLKEKGKNEYL